MLDLRRLQALHAVVATGSVKDAAARLGYTPSAVSQHITTLERETRTVLLEPAGRGVRPTAAGQLLAAHAAALLDRLAEAEAALAALTAGETGMLRLLWSLDLSHRKTRPRHPQTDEKAQQAFKKGGLQPA